MSNSSSTSFCICGIYREVTKEQGDAIEAYNDTKPDVKVSYISQFCEEDNPHYIGINIEYMLLDETKSQFMARSAQLIREVIKEDIKPKECSFMTDGWYDG